MPGVFVVYIPRTFSTLAMCMLTDGGLDPIVDEKLDRIRPAAPRGYMESGAVNANAVTALSGVDLAGRCVKVPARHVPALLDAAITPDLALVMRRPVTESRASFLARFERDPTDEWARWANNLNIAHQLLLAAGVATLEVNGHDLIDYPMTQSYRIAAHLPGLDAAAMAKVPDPALRHYRTAS